MDELIDRDPVKVSIKSGIATVKIDRPHRKNALSVATANALTESWRELDANDDVRVIILTSSDCGVFSAGMDLKEVGEIFERDGVDALTLVNDPFHIVMRNISKPIIAAMTGSAVAGGMLLSLSSDIRIGLAGTVAGITEVRVGRGSPWAAPLMPMLPNAILSEMLLTGETFSIEKLRDFGFVNYVEKTPEEVRARAHKLAESIKSGAPLSIKAAKASLRAWNNYTAEPGFEESLKLHAEVYSSRDAKEGPRAFSERRLPVWEGK